MSFFEEIATSLDARGIESRVHDSTLFVPITSEVEIQFSEIDPAFPAANVYVAAVDDEQDYDAVLVGVVLSTEEAVETVALHIATDQIVTLIRDLLNGADERISDIDFYQDREDPHLLYAPVAEDSYVEVRVDTEKDKPFARVSFVVDLEEPEEIELGGDITDWDRLFDVISLAADNAEDWEDELREDVYDLPIDTDCYVAREEFD